MYRNRFCFASRIVLTNLALGAACIAVAIPLPMQAQTFTVIHNFAGAADGANPLAGLTVDRQGNLYGTTSCGGIAPGCYYGNGTVFRLSDKDSGWILTPLYIFSGGTDGGKPGARVVFGPDRTLYGTANSGGNPICDDCGVVFNLIPPPTPTHSIRELWTQTVLYSFTGENSGNHPGNGDLIFDQAGNIYGTTSGGYSDNGDVYELTRSNGAWTENILHAFRGPPDGTNPYDGVIFDRVGNLYGTTVWGGGTGLGTVFQLAHSPSGWTENILYSFEGLDDGGNPQGGLIFDQAGNLYGATTSYGQYGGEGGGTVFEFTPSNGSWAFSLLYAFPGLRNGGPFASLTIDGSGNLYGTTYQDGAYGDGSVFKLTHQQNGTWTYTDLHDFGGTDGAAPEGILILGADGNLYGTTSSGGAYGNGVVFEITP